jgi:hypothetical protein
MLDSAKSYDGRNTNSDHYMYLSSATTLLSQHANGSSFAYFDATFIGKTVFVYDVDGQTLVKFLISSINSSSSAAGTCDRAIPGTLAEAVPCWSLAISSMGELWHLAYMSVGVVGDGFVEANPLNSADSSVIAVSNTTGKAMFSRAYERVHVGKAYLSSIQTLAIDAQNVPGGGLIDKDAIVNKLYISVFETRALKVGTTDPEADGDQDLSDFSSVQRRANDTSYDFPQDAETARWDQDLITDWSSKGGQVVIVQVDPLPATILAIVPQGVTYT